MIAKHFPSGKELKYNATKLKPRSVYLYLAMLSVIIYVNSSYLSFQEDHLNEMATSESHVEAVKVVQASIARTLELLVGEGGVW